MAFEATSDFSIPITDQLYDEIIGASLIDFETGHLILTSDDIDYGNEMPAVESELKYMDETHACILGEALCRMGRDKNVELVYEYSRFRLMTDPRKKSYLIVRELYLLPDETWVLRAHKGAINNPKKIEYWEIDARSAKASLERELRDFDYKWEQELRPSGFLIWSRWNLKVTIDLYFSV